MFARTLAQASFLFSSLLAFGFFAIPAAHAQTCPPAPTGAGGDISISICGGHPGGPPAPQPPQALSNVLFIPGTEASRLYYRDKNFVEHQVWEPSKNADLSYLAMNPDGTSKYALYTKDIIDSLESHNLIESAIGKTLGNNLEVYSGLEHYLHNLSASTTIDFKTWKAYPYDWRHDVFDIVQNGTNTEFPDGSIHRVYITNVLKQLASTSPTGKVTVIAHSNGGLVAKALAITLGAQASRYIDHIIFIGTPQWGTPAAIGAMLHGDGETQALGLVENGADARAVTKSMPGPYELLPSESYFTHVVDPVASFDNGNITKKLAATFGSALTSLSQLNQFLTNSTGLSGVYTATISSDLYKPLVLSSSLLSAAQATQRELNAWTLPAGIAVDTIAGWGQNTVKTLSYSTKYHTVCGTASVPIFTTCSEQPYLEHTAVTTQDGDGTVVSPSATGVIGNHYYFNAARFAGDKHGNIFHKELPSAKPIDAALTNILEGKPATTAYVTPDKPNNGSAPITIVSSHSPVHLEVTDRFGNTTGIVPVPGTGLSLAVQNIPGSAVHVLDHEEYVYLPTAGTYRIVAHGYATGFATLETAVLQTSGAASTTAVIADIPTTASSTATLPLADGSVGTTTVDINGNGTTDLVLVTVASSTNPAVFLRQISGIVQTLSLANNIQRYVQNQLHAMQQILSRADSHITRLRHRHGPRQTKRIITSTLHTEKRVIARRIALVDKYITQQLRVQSRRSRDETRETNKEKRGHLPQQRISPTDAAQLLAMMKQLKSLF